MRSAYFTNDVFNFNMLSTYKLYKFKTYNRICVSFS